MDKKTKVTKKNTLLYLDENLVELAKEKNFNISELAEEAIRTKLNINGYHKRFDPEEYLENLRKKGLAYYIPFRINKISIDNYRFVKKIEVDFKHKNLIVGVNGSGKTRLIRSLLMFFDNSHSTQSPSRDECPQGPGEIKISFDQMELLACEVCGERISMENGCILIDEGLGKLDQEAGIVFLKYLLDRKEQIIITSVSAERYSSELRVKEFNMIKMEYDPAQDLYKRQIVLVNNLHKFENELMYLINKRELVQEMKSEKGDVDAEKAEIIQNKIMDLDACITQIKKDIEKIHAEMDEFKGRE